MQRVFFPIILVLSCLSFRSYGQQAAGNTYTLKQCIETGIANNLDVQQRGLQMEASEVNWKQSRLNRLPDLNGSVGQGINQGRSIDPFTNGYINQQINVASYSLSSGVVLFNGLAISSNIKQNAYAFEASKMDWQQAKDNLTINIILAYLQVLSNEDQLVQSESQQALTQKQVQRLDILNNDGAIKPSDLYDLRGQLSNDQLLVISNRNALETAKVNLCQLMNILYDKEMKLERIDPGTFSLGYDGTPGQVYQKALSQFALIKAAELKTKSAESAVKVARGQLFPVLSLNGSANSNYSSAAMQSILINTTAIPTADYVLVNSTPSPVIHLQNNYQSEKISYSRQLNNNIFTSVSLNLSIPIFNSLQARNKIKLARIDARNYSLIEKTAKTQLQQNVERAYINMLTAFDRYKTLLDQVSSYTQSFRAAEIRFNEGVGNPIDYLTAKNNLDLANSNLIIARYDYVLKTKILDYYQGKASW